MGHGCWEMGHGCSRVEVVAWRMTILASGRTFGLGHKVVATGQGLSRVDTTEEGGALGPKLGARGRCEARRIGARARGLTLSAGSYGGTVRSYYNGATAVGGIYGARARAMCSMGLLRMCGGALACVGRPLEASRIGTESFLHFLQSFIPPRGDGLELMDGGPSFFPQGFSCYFFPKQLQNLGIFPTLLKSAMGGGVFKT